MRLLAIIAALMAVAVPAVVGAATAPPPFVKVWSGGRNLTAVRADGTELRLSDGTSPDVLEDWSPDGSTIAFLRSTRFQVWPVSGEIGLVGLDGSPPRFVAVGEAPRWSPNGHWLTYQKQTSLNSEGFETGMSFDLFVTRADGSAPRRLAGGAGEAPGTQPLTIGSEGARAGVGRLTLRGSSSRSRRIARATT